MHTLTFAYVYTSMYCRSASTTPSGSPCSSQQSVYHQGDGDALSALSAPSTQPSWNPFGDDNFSKLTAEELLNKDFAKLAECKFNISTSIFVALVQKILSCKNDLLLFVWAQLLHKERRPWAPMKISFQGLMLFQVRLCFILLSTLSHISAYCL